MNLMYMGEGPNKYWELINGNKIRQNILWACYNDSLTEEEIALQIGVALPYIEDDIKLLTDVWLLKKEGRHYRTNIIILTSDFDAEKAVKLLPLQKQIAEKLKNFISRNEAEIRSVGFYKSNMSFGVAEMAYDNHDVASCVRYGERQISYRCRKTSHGVWRARVYLGRREYKRRIQLLYHTS